MSAEAVGGLFIAPLTGTWSRHAQCDTSSRGSTKGSPCRLMRHVAVRDFWYSLPGFQKEKLARMSCLLPDQSSSNSFVRSCLQKCIISVDFPAPGFPDRWKIPLPCSRLLRKACRYLPRVSYFSCSASSVWVLLASRLVLAFCLICIWVLG